MKIGELSRRSGVSIPTIKYYLREGLLSAGTATAANQASYDDEHLRRLRLIRALVEVGGLSVAATAEVLRRVDDPEVYGHNLLGSAHYAIAPPARGSRTGERWDRARQAAAELVSRRDWRVSEQAPALDSLADVLAAFDDLGQPRLAGAADRYADFAEQIAALDLSIVAARGDRPAELVEAVVVGTVLSEAMLNALRRLAQEDASARRFAPSDPRTAAPETETGLEVSGTKRRADKPTASS